MTTAPAPGTPEWARLVTASKVAAILGVSPWDSPRRIWHVLRGDLPADDGTNSAAKSRGHYLEAGILDWWVDQHPEFTHIKRQWYCEMGDWAAATPDGAAWTTRPATFSERRPPDALVDAKTARDDNEWGAPGTDEVPPYYAAQLQWAMHISGAQRAYIALLTSRLDLREYALDYDPATALAIEAICKAFWDSTRDDTAAPPIDDTVSTFQTLKALHPSIDPDTAIELDEATAAEFIEATQAAKAAEARDRKARSTVLDLMGQARLAVFDGVTVARRQPNAHGISLVPVAKTLPASEVAA